MLLEGSGSIPVFTDGVLSPTLEAALRYDTGDAETGAGLEIGTTLGYSVGSLSLQINARTLVAHEDAAYKERGFGGTVSYQPGRDGKGLLLEMGSQWGASRSGVDALWSRTGESGLVPSTAASNAARKFTAELGYGFEGRKRGAFWLPFMAAESGRYGKSIRFGVKLDPGPNLEMGLELGQRRQRSQALESALQLSGRLQF